MKPQSCNALYSFFILLSLIVMIFASPCVATGEEQIETRGLEDVLSGFEEEARETEEVAPKHHDKDEDPKRAEEAAGRPFQWDLTGSFTVAATYNVSHEAPGAGEADFRELSRWRTELDLRFQCKLFKDWKVVFSGRAFFDFAYLIKGRSMFTDEVLDTYEHEAELFDAYIQGSLLDNLDLKAGRQVVVWGRSDNLRVTDVLNPLDNREPGLVDIEDLRLPVTMVRLDYYHGPWNMTALVIPEIRFGKDPVFGSEFFPLDMRPPYERSPDCAPENMEYGLALNGLFSGWDLSIYAARIFDDQAHVDQVVSTSGGGGQAISVLERRHSELFMAGTAVNLAWNNWLLKAEAAYVHGFEFLSARGKKSRLDLLAGLEYTGFTDTMLSMEVVERHLFDFESGMKAGPDFAQEDTFQLVARMNRTFFNETLEVTLLGSMLGETGQDGAFERISAAYDVTDALVMSGGVILYQGGDNIFFRNIGDSDRIFLEFEYSF